MKRWIVWMIICVLCLGGTGTASAEEFKLKTDYDTIVGYYDSAVEAQEDNDLEEAISDLDDLIRYYKKQANPAIARYKDAQLYYAYALGRVELSYSNPDYAYAREQLTKCGDDLHMAVEYRQYAKGMTEKENADYYAAIVDLRAVRSKLTEFTAICIQALEECEELYKTSVLNKSQNACQTGNHERALELYNQYLELFDYDTEIRKLRNECQNTHNNEEVVEEVGLEIISAVPSAQKTVQLSWKGTKDEYTVSWTSDLAGGKDAKSANVKGKTYTVTGLFPGTVYRFTVSYQSVSVQIDRETRKAEDYPPEINQDHFWTGSTSLFRFGNTRHAFMNSGKASYEFANDKSCKYLKNRTVDLYENPISESAVLFVFTTFGVPQNINGKSYQLLLHIDGTATLTEKGVFGKADKNGVIKICAEGSYIYAVVYDLFDQAVENYSDLSGKDFRLDLLVDDKFVGSGEGFLK